MGVSKMKNLIIAVMLLINVFFLIIIAVDRTGDAQRERQSLADACAVLARAGIEVDPGSVEKSPGLRAMNTARDIESQRTIARVVLGAVTESEQGGGLFLYENEETGSAVFKSGGDFTISVNSGAYQVSSDAPGAARSLMRDMGLEFGGFESSNSDGVLTVTAQCAYKGARIFNCTLEFRFEVGNLTGVSGKYVYGISATEEAEEISSPAAALLTFLSAVKKGVITCEKITSVVAGYYARDAAAFSGGGLVPAWLLTADSGQYVIDADAGEIMHVIG